MTPMSIWIDGRLVAPEQATVSVFDHGLLYGDGVFEGIRVYNRRVFRLDAHLDRLYASAQALALDDPARSRRDGRRAVAGDRARNQKRETATSASS